MRLLHAFFLSLLLSCAFAQGNATTTGGNITEIDAHAELVSSWHGVVGWLSDEEFFDITINATPGDITTLTVNTSGEDCKHGVEAVHVLFSNSTTEITDLEGGNLTLLDGFISSPGENGMDTFLITSTFKTEDYGNIYNVPTTYTNAADPSVFRMGYLQDQDGNLVFITMAFEDNGKPGYNGTIFDFQMMLPSRDHTPVEYYLTVDIECKQPPGKPRPSGGGTGGGGSGRMFYNQTGEVEVPPEVGPSGPNITFCDIILYCEDYGPCVDGYMKQRCYDMTNCSDIEVFRVKKCGAVTVPPAREEEEELIPRFIVEHEFPCWLLLLFILILIILALIYWRRKRREEGAPGFGEEPVTTEEDMVP